MMARFSESLYCLNLGIAIGPIVGSHGTLRGNPYLLYKVPFRTAVATQITADRGIRNLYLTREIALIYALLAQIF